MFGYFLKYWLRLLFFLGGKLKIILNELDRWIRTTTPLARIVISFPVFVLTYLAFQGFLSALTVRLIHPLIPAAVAFITVLVMHVRAYVLDPPAPKNSRSNQPRQAPSHTKSDDYDSSVYLYSNNNNDDET